MVLPLLMTLSIGRVRSSRLAFWLGLAGAGLELGFAVKLLLNFKTDTPGFQFVEKLSSMPFLPYHLGVDGISLLFVLLTALLSLLVLFYGEMVHEEPAGPYVASIFAFETVLMGLFLSIDFLGFWYASLLELIPVVFILHRFGVGAEKNKAIVDYIRYMAGGLGLMLAGISILAWHSADMNKQWSFALNDLLMTPHDGVLQSIVFVLLFYGLGVRMAFFPFHAWLPLVARHGTLATVCIFLVGLKVGIYALLRFVLPILPQAVDAWKDFVVGLAILGIFYGALQALMQINLRKLLAYAAISHSGMLVIGVFCLNLQGFEGSLLSAINFGAAASGLFFVTAVLYKSTGTAYLPRLGGMFDAMPLLGLTFLLAALSTMGMPGTPGFDAAHLMLEGALETYEWPVSLMVAGGSVLSAAFLLWAFQRAFLAERKDAALHPKEFKLSLQELLLVGTLCSLLLGMGFYSEPWLKIVEASLSYLAEQYETSNVH